MICHFKEAVKSEKSKIKKKKNMRKLKNIKNEVTGEVKRVRLVPVTAAPGEPVKGRGRYKAPKGWHLTSKGSQKSHVRNGK